MASPLLALSGPVLQGVPAPRGIAYPVGPVFKPVRPASQLKEAANKIQAIVRSKQHSQRYEKIMAEFSLHKVLYARVETPLAPPELTKRTVARAKAAYAAPREEQAAAVEQGLEQVRSAREEAEVVAYNKAKARAAVKFRPARPLSQLNAAASTIQAAHRQKHRSGRFHAALANLAAANAVFQLLKSPLTPEELRVRQLTRMQHAYNASVDEQLATVEAGLERGRDARDEKEVERYAQAKRVALIRVVPRHPQSVLHAVARMIQTWWRRVRTRRRFDTAARQWEQASKPLFASKGSPRASQPAQAPTTGAQRRFMATMYSPRSSHTAAFPRAATDAAAQHTPGKQTKEVGHTSPSPTPPSSSPDASLTPESSRRRAALALAKFQEAAVELFFGMCETSDDGELFVVDEGSRLLLLFTELSKLATPTVVSAGTATTAGRQQLEGFLTRQPRAGLHDRYSFEQFCALFNEYTRVIYN